MIIIFIRYINGDLICMVHRTRLSWCKYNINFDVHCGAVRMCSLLSILASHGQVQQYVNSIILARHVYYHYRDTL